MTDVVQHRSRAWTMGWLAVSGPPAVVLSVVVTLALQNVQIYVATMLLQFWVLAGVVLGIAAVVVGARDARLGRRSSAAGAVVGGVGALLCVVELLAAGYVLSLLNQL